MSSGEFFGKSYGASMSEAIVAASARGLSDQSLDADTSGGTNQSLTFFAPGKRTKVLFLALDINLSRARGDSVHTVELAKAFHTLGHEVTLVVGAGGPLADDLPAAVKLRVVTGRDLPVAMAILLNMRESPPDVIYERRTTPKIGYVLSRLFSSPLVLEVNGLLDDELIFQGRESSQGVHRRVRTWVRSRLMRRVDRFVVVSKAIAEDLVLSHKVEPSRISVIGNGVNVERFRPHSKAEASVGVGLSPDLPRIIFVGNLVGWRDLDSMLTCLSEVRESHPDTELIIVGDGQDRSRLEARAKSQYPAGAVRFLGTRPHGEIPLWICASDVCLLPAVAWKVDVSPLKLFEYLACGRPVVATSVPGLELVQDLNLGRIVPPGDSHSLAEAITKILSDPSLGRDLGLRGRDYVERERSWTAVASRVLMVIREAMRSS